MNKLPEKPYAVINIPIKEDVLIDVCKKMEGKLRTLSVEDWIEDIVMPLTGTNGFGKIGIFVNSSNFLHYNSSAFYKETNNGFNYIEYEDFMKLFEKKIKMKKIIEKLTEEYKEIDITYLIKENACSKAIEWFADTFGSRANFKDVLDRARKERHDSNWLKGKTDYFKNEISDEDVIEINKISFKEDSIIILKANNSFYKLAKVKLGACWMRLNGMGTGRGKFYNSPEEAIINHIYRNEIYIFEDYNSFLNWLVKENVQ
jgi:hypothetical protein